MPPKNVFRPGLTVVEHPLIRVKLSELRDEQTSSENFRRNLREISSLMAFEMARNFETRATSVRTPLRQCEGAELVHPVILAPILRAGLGMAEGMQSALSEVSIGHIGLFRNEETLRPESYYFKLPSHLAEAEVLVVDPMLATGWSACAAIDQLKRHGAKRIRFACIVSCPEGIHQLQSCHPEVPIYTAAIDEGLNEKGYILPGLGDAGDRYFGTFSRQGPREEGPRDEAHL